MTLELSRELREALEDLGRCLMAMGEYRRRSVLAGGLAAVVYRYLMQEVDLEHPPMTTHDADVGLPIPLEVIGGRTLTARMMEADFELYSAGEEPEKAFFFKHRDRNPGRFSPIHVEFISPIPEGEDQRTEQGRSVELQADLHVQALGYIELLFQEAITVMAAQVPPLGISGDVEFQVANPAMYIVQKLLARDRRSEHKKEKDLAYIYDVVLLHRHSWHEIGALLARVTHQRETYGERIRRALRELRTLFEAETADGPLAVVSEYRLDGYPEIREATVAEVMKQFLEEVELE